MTKNKKSKILITGGAGFIGSHTAKKLIDEGYAVVIIDNLNNYYEPKLKRDRLKFFLHGYKFDFIKADISDYNALKKIFFKHKFDAVCHLAAQAGVRYSLQNPFAYEKTNILGTLNILELAKEFKIKKIVMASSSSVYGKNKKVPFSEEDKVDAPSSLYAATKKSTELLAYCYHDLHNLDIIALRFFTVYGPWGRPDMAYFKFADLIRQGKPIGVYNFGKMKRDFTYVDNIVWGVVSVIQKLISGKISGYEIFNLGNDKPENLEKFINLIEKNFGKKAVKNYLPMQLGDVPATWANINKAKKMLGYEPKTKIEQGIKKFVDWYKEYYKL